MPHSRPGVSTGAHFRMSECDCCRRAVAAPAFCSGQPDTNGGVIDLDGAVLLPMTGAPPVDSDDMGSLCCPPLDFL